MKKQIPNTITLLNLLCGTLSIIMLLYYNNPFLASMFIILGAIFDFFDGMMARLLKVSSPVGKELDSLSDVVSFGVAPSLIAFYYVRTSALPNDLQNILCWIPLVMAMMSSYRLAKFNLDERQTSSFIGLPTPANAMLWLSLPLLEYADSKEFYSILPSFSEWMVTYLPSAYFILPVCLLTSYLLVCERPMFSLKFHNLKWKENKIRFIFLILVIVLIALFNLRAIQMIICLYILMSLLCCKQ